MAKNMKQIAQTVDATTLVEISYPILKGLSKLPDTLAIELKNNKKKVQFLIQQNLKGLKLSFMQQELIYQVWRQVEFYKTIFEIDMSVLHETQFNTTNWDSNYMPTVLAMSPKHSIGEIDEVVKDKFGKGIYNYKNPNTEIQTTAMDKRPTGIYLLACTDQDEPDEKWRNKSYNYSKGKINFFQPKEYKIGQCYRLYRFLKMWDIKGYARLDGVWSDGFLVCGDAGSDGSELGLNNGDVSIENPEYGPRELFLF